MSNGTTDAVWTRLVPAIMAHLNDIGLSNELLSSVHVQLESGDGGAIIHVSVVNADGVQPLMTLDPATHGLLVVDGQLGVDDFEE